MKYLIRQAGYCRANGSKIAMALAFASAISILPISSAFADDDGGHGRGGDQHEGYGRGDREGYGYRPGYQQPYGYGYRPGYQQPYGYAQPVYVPPPVYYPPQQSPGINLFLPLDLRR